MHQSNQNHQGGQGKIEAIFAIPETKIYDMSIMGEDSLVQFFGQYPTIKLGTKNLVSKRIIQGINRRRTGMGTQ